MLLFKFLAFIMGITTLGAAADSSSTVKSTPKPQAPPPIARPAIKSIQPLIEKAQIPVPPTGDLFTHPGVVMIKGGRWFGSDSFMNFPSSIAVQVDVIKPESLEMPIDKEALKKIITTIFSSEDVSELAIGENGKPPLPFFNLLVMAYPTEKGISAVCIAKLFEEVTLSRLSLTKDQIFQAITWQQANFIVVAYENQFEPLLNTTVEAIAKNFIKRVSAFRSQSRERAIEQQTSSR